MKSLNASTQGLARIRQARQRITQENGWTVDHEQWLEQASSFLPLVKNGKGMVRGTVGISTWKRFLAGKPVKPTNFKAFCQVLGLNWEDVVEVDKIFTVRAQVPLKGNLRSNDWGEATDVSIFYGRTEELATLKQWVVQDNCRLIGLLGMGGIGKTTLSVKFAQQVQHEFDYVIWRSLQNAPPVNDILATLSEFLSHQQETPANLPESTSIRITRLIEYLRSSRCLIVLDNAESILQAGTVAFQYRPGYEEYGELIKRVGQTSHRSCLILTSCEKPQELATLEGKTLPVRSLALKGLHEEEAREIFQAKGIFVGTSKEWKVLIQHYAGNPLALNMVASCIRDVFGSRISDFFKHLKAGLLPFADISQLLERQFNRLTDLELEALYWLAINREAIDFSSLKNDIMSPHLKQQLPEVLKCLIIKSLVEKTNGLFTLQPMVMDYTANLLIARMCEEIETIRISLLNSHSLLKDRAKDHVMDTQLSIILKPIKDRLIYSLRGKTNLENRLNQILSEWQTKYTLTPGYIADNVTNLLDQLNTDGKR
ncbi:NB-ARC domain-containing protein [Microseira wollei]|uniref:WD-repeat protein n=1 Tax=Microseira wollei NIES-4236 TaxID=2530354 RepID=A0AAV3X4I0_9CYAN|nr:NB-ARC domain-containing protein [Microseira wollei]GET36091.1 WD-repeat protein [Microseira wollei NIES-4236]